MVTPEHRRTTVTLAMTTAEVSERRACRFTGFARTSQRYQSRRPRRTELRERLLTLATLRPRCGDAAATLGLPTALRAAAAGRVARQPQAGAAA